MDNDVKQVLDAVIAKTNGNTQTLKDLVEKLNQHSEGFSMLRKAFLQMNQQLRLQAEQIATLEAALAPRPKKSRKKTEITHEDDREAV